MPIKVNAKTPKILNYLQVSYTQSTGVKSATLGKNGTEHLMRLDRDKCKFPIVLSFNFMVCTTCYLSPMLFRAVHAAREGLGHGGGIRPTSDTCFAQFRACM